MNDDERRDVIVDAANEVGRPTLFSMLIIIAAHIPIFALQRHEGRIFQPMALSVTTALVGSLIFSLTLVPLLAYWMLRKQAAARRQPRGARPQAACTRRCWTGRCARAQHGGRHRAGRVRAWPWWRRRGWARSSCPSSTKARSGSTCACRPACRSTRPPRILRNVRKALLHGARGAHHRLQGRPARGRHRPQDHQHGRGLRRPQAAGGVAQGHHARSS